MGIAVRNDRPQRRYSGLLARLASLRKEKYAPNFSARRTRGNAEADFRP